MNQLHKICAYGLIVATSIVLWNTWYGDATIYLSGRWLMFNAGEVSGVYTSPLWALVASVFHSPDLFKAVSLAVTVWAAWTITESVEGAMGQLLSVFALFYFFWHGLLGFETSLAIGLMACLHRGSVWAAYLLPLVRPEGAILSLIYAKDKHRYLSIAPFAIWFALTLYLDNGSSIVSRLGNHFEWRYLALPITVLLLEASIRYGFNGIVAVCILAGFSLQGEYTRTMREASRGYDFETITMRPIAEHLNRTLDTGAVISSREIQLRRWLRDDLRIDSPEGLVKAGQWQYRVASDRDGIDSTLTQEILWEVKVSGFVDWFVLEKRKSMESYWRVR